MKRVPERERAEAKGPDANPPEAETAPDTAYHLPENAQALLERYYEGPVERCYRELRPWFFEYGLRRARDRDLADDYADEAFIQILRKMEKCDLERFGDSGFIGWARKVGVNKIEDLERKRRRRELLLPLRDSGDPDDDEDGGSIEGVASRASSPLEDAERREMRDQIEAALSDLTETERRLLVLKEFEDRSHHEIAAILATTVDASKAMLHRARTKLRQMARLRAVHEAYPVAAATVPSGPRVEA